VVQVEDAFKSWCRSRHIRPRFGAVDEHGSIAIIERFEGLILDPAALRGASVTTR
jgi:hypothetical protein